MTNHNDRGSSLGRAFAILDLFTLEHPVLTVEIVTEHLKYTRSMAYRYLRELACAGLVTPTAPGVFSLGPRIIELERLMALTDPLYRAGLEVLHEAPSNSALLLHNLYEDKVLCILNAGPDTLDCSGQRITIRRARGIPFPLFQGAASLALLPWLSAHQIRETYLQNTKAIANARLGDNWEEFRRSMMAVRRTGYATSHGTITPLVSGVAVPILAPSGRLLGSLARAMPTELLQKIGEAQVADDLYPLAQRIAKTCVSASARDVAP
ncbi:IclR family transcriptional regulator [Bordetella tumulicola]|uniref:IclR family transcriptional regulator n=1 Tax=Bordetella tumulicola TaxID=1649133 RepID=UPI0039EE3948